MLYTIREFVNTKVLKLVYHAIFDCHLSYADSVWGQKTNSLNRLFLLQKKALESLVLDAEMLIQTLFSIGMK